MSFARKRITFECTLPWSAAGRPSKLEIEWENGELEHHWFWGPELQTLATGRVEGNEWIAKRVPLPKPLRLGYHRIRILVMREPEVVGNFRPGDAIHRVPGGRLFRSRNAWRGWR